jgi:YVTN family beta-propeller protein
MGNRAIGKGQFFQGFINLVTGTDAMNHQAASGKLSLSLLLILLASSCPFGSANSAYTAESAAGLRATLPSGRRITPAGDWIKVAPYPYTLAVRPDGNQVVVPSIGWPFSLNIIDQPGATTANASVQRIPAGRKNDPQIQVHTGIVYSADGRLLYDATGDTGAVHIFSTQNWKRVGEIPLNGVTAGKNFAQSFAAAVALTPDGRLLYVLDQGNWRVVVIDTASCQRIASLPTGANPFSIALSPDARRLYVTNSGLFEYKTLPGADKTDILHSGVGFPPFGYPSKAAREGVRAQGINVPGLGEENDPRGSSLWSYDVADPAKPNLLAQLRLGQSIGSDSASAAKSAIGGASPTGVVAGSDHVYVSLAHEDSIAVISADGSRLLQEIALTPFEGADFVDRHGRPLRGIMPAGLALRGRRLYIAEAGINAVAVIDTGKGHVLGHLPVGWFPTAVAVSLDGSLLYVANTKGKGSGPNGGDAFHPVNTGSYIGELEFGSVSVIRLADESHLQASTAVVVANNLAAAAPNAPLPRLKHVFLVIRENRTYDEILGDLAGSDGDPKLARWGMHGWLSSAPQDKTIAVTPNAHALAQRFATSDRFFVDSDVSADGHRWVMGAAPTPWFHVAWTSNYGGRRTGDDFSAAPGRRALNGGNDAPMPEDEPEFGTLWEHIADAGLSIRNYGEGLEIEGAQEIDGTAPTGQRLVLNSPVPQPVFTSTDREFPTFNLGIPDQYRYNEFAKDFAQVLDKGDAPSLIVIRLPCDHTAGPRVKDGYPDRGSYVADNDLALGKIVEFVSRSAIWKDSAIFVVEDDAQGGVDHVDAHRSVMLAISPYIRKGAVSHRHSSMGSIQKTAYELLGLGPLNLEDRLAPDLSDMFSAMPDLEPFSSVASDPHIFDPAKARVARPRNAEQARELLDCDDPKEIEAEFRREAKTAKTAESGGR